MPRAMTNHRYYNRESQENAYWDALFERLFWNPFQQGQPSEPNVEPFPITYDQSKTKQQRKKKRCNKHRCPECGQIFDTRTDLLNHQRQLVHHNWDARCNECGMCFNDTKYLKRHLTNRKQECKKKLPNELPPLAASTQ